MNRRLIVLAVLNFIAHAEWRRQGTTRLEVQAKGHLEARVHHQHERSNNFHGPWHQEVKSNELCKQLSRMLTLKGCGLAHSQVRVGLQRSEIQEAASTAQWPLSHCTLPQPTAPGSVFASFAEDASAACATVALAASASGVELLWHSLPAGGAIVVPLGTNSSAVRAEGLVWQSMYALNSRMYYSDFHDMKAPQLSLPDLQFATFFEGYGILQKADRTKDISASYGRFYALAQDLESDKISIANNYSLLYHRNLDAGGRDEKSGLAVEIGTGCFGPEGPAKAVKFWPQYFKRLRVHLLRGESDRQCLARWMGQIHSNGVGKVHIGQATQSGKTSPLYTLKRDIQIAGPAGLQVVVDRDEGGNTETEASFRGLFPKLSPGGLYFLEDLMRSTWRNPSNMRLDGKYMQTAYTPLALSAIMATAAAGLDASLTLNKKEATEALAQLQGEGDDHGSLLATPLSWARGMLQNVRALMSGSAVESIEASDHRAWAWRQKLMLSQGRMVNFVECSPGVCTIQRNGEM